MAFVEEFTKLLEIIDRIRRRYLEWYADPNTTTNKRLAEKFYKLYTQSIPNLLHDFFEALRASGAWLPEDYNIQDVYSLLCDSSFKDALQALYELSSKKGDIAALLVELQKLKNEFGLTMIKLENSSRFED